MVRLQWKTHLIMTFKFIHKTFGFLLIALSQITILLGTLYYNSMYGSNTSNGIINICVFYGLLIVIEIIHQIFKRQETPFKTCRVFITSEEFDQRITQGEKLVLLDDLVLDVSKYCDNHPGGKFLLEYNIGRDVSKFFYGGYSMENFTWKPRIHYHSNIARTIINQLVVAKIQTVTPRFEAKILNKTYQNSATNTIIF